MTSEWGGVIKHLCSKVYVEVNAQGCIEFFALHESFRMFSIVLDKLAKVGVYVRLRT